MRVLLLLFLPLWLCAQEFSALPNSKDIFLNFDDQSIENQGVCFDEEYLLAWQNTQRLPIFSSPDKAQKYCRQKRDEGLNWRLPNVQELKTLYLPNFNGNIKSEIIAGHNKAFLASDQPIYDHRLWFGFNYARGGVMVFKKGKKSLFVRCVANLE